MLKKIYQELVLIRKELQAIRSSMELDGNIDFDAQKIINALKETTFQVF